MQEQLKITFKGKSYESKPLKVGTFIDIEKAKALLSAGQYGSMVRMATGVGDESLMMIDIEATISVLFPKLIEDIKPATIRDLGLKDYREFRTLYTEKVFNWLKESVKVLNYVDEEDKKLV